MPRRTAPHAQDSWSIKRRFQVIQFAILLGFLRCMAKEQKNDVNTLQEIPQPLSNEEKELIEAALKLVLAKRRNAIMITIPTLAKHIQMMLPYNIRVDAIAEYVKERLKDRLTTLQDRIGNDELKIEAVRLYDNIEQLIEAFKQRKIDTTIKLIDSSLDSVEDYKNYA